jgi:hypothetical protein
MFGAAQNPPAHLVVRYLRNHVHRDPLAIRHGEFRGSSSPHRALLAPKTNDVIDTILDQVEIKIDDLSNRFSLGR